MKKGFRLLRKKWGNISLKLSVLQVCQNGMLEFCLKLGRLLSLRSLMLGMLVGVGSMAVVGITMVVAAITTEVVGITTADIMAETIIMVVIMVEAGVALLFHSVDTTMVLDVPSCKDAIKMDVVFSSGYVTNLCFLAS